MKKKRLTREDWAKKGLKETYISVDIEADGPNPGRNSMLSLGAAAFTREGTMLGTFYRNFKPLPNGERDPDTMKFWGMHDKAWKETQVNQERADKATQEFVDWATTFENPVFVAYPSGFDFSYVYWYLTHFKVKNPFSWSSLDMKTLAMAIMNTPYRKTVKKEFPAEWFDGSKHDHNALNDAIEQGHICVAMLRELDNLVDQSHKVLK